MKFRVHGENKYTGTVGTWRYEDESLHSLEARLATNSNLKVSSIEVIYENPEPAIEPVDYKKGSVINYIDPKNSPEKCLKRMDSEGAEYITWTNKHTGARFVCGRGTVEKYLFNFQFENRNNKKPVAEKEIVKIIDTSMTVDELLFEIGDADSLTIKEGMAKTVVTTVNKVQISVLSELLYNKDFDCSILFL